MKKLTLIVILLLSINTISFGQTEPQEIKEIGVLATTYGLGATYRFGDKTSLWKVRLMVNELRNETVRTGTRIFEFDDINMGIHFGKEWRKYVSTKLAFRYGIEVGYQFERVQELRSLTNAPDVIDRDFRFHKILITGTAGLQYDLSDQFFISVETLPFFGLAFETFEEERLGIPTTTKSKSGEAFLPYGISLGLRF